MDNHEWDSPAQSPDPELPAKVPRRWVGPSPTGDAVPEPAPVAGPERGYKPDRGWDKLLVLVGIAVVVAAVLIVPGLLNRGGENPVAEAAQATMDSPGVRMDFSATIQGSVQATMQGKGVLNGETKRGAVGIGMSISGSESADFQMQEIVDDHDVYIRAPSAGSALSLPDGWIRLSVDGFDSSGDGLLSGTSSSSPKQLLDSLTADSDDVAVVGQEQLGKHTVTHYTASIDMGKIADEARDQGGDEAADLVDQLNPTETVDVWIDGDGLLRRMTANANFGSLMSMVVTINFYDYGIHPQIDLPPDSQVQDLSSISG